MNRCGLWLAHQGDGRQHLGWVAPVGIQKSTLHIYDDADHNLNQTHAVQIAETIRSRFYV